MLVGGDGPPWRLGSEIGVLSCRGRYVLGRGRGVGECYLVCWSWAAIRMCRRRSTVRESRKVSVKSSLKLPLKVMISRFTCRRGILAMVVARWSMLEVARFGMLVLFLM